MCQLVVSLARNALYSLSHFKAKMRLLAGCPPNCLAALQPDTSAHFFFFTSMAHNGLTFDLLSLPLLFFIFLFYILVIAYCIVFAPPGRCIIPTECCQLCHIQTQKVKEPRIEKKGAIRIGDMKRGVKKRSDRHASDPTQISFGGRAFSSVCWLFRILISLKCVPSCTPRNEPNSTNRCLEWFFTLSGQGGMRVFFMIRSPKSIPLARRCSLLPLLFDPD